MKNIIYFVICYTLISCSSKSGITIENLNDNYAMVTRYYNEDSLEMWYPYKIKVTNNTLKRIHIGDASASQLRSMCEILTENGENITYIGEIKPKIIPRFGSKVFVCFISYKIAKTILQGEVKISNPKLVLKATSLDIEILNKKILYDKIKEDSISFNFNNDDGFYMCKTAKISEGKFHTITIDDITRNRNDKKHRSIFDPSQY